MNNVNMMGNHGMNWGGGWHFGIIGLIVGIVILFLIVKILIGIAFMHHQHRGERQKTGKTQKEHVSDYKAAGLSDSDISLFREKMAAAKGNIEIWEAASREFTDISVIEDVTGGLSAAKKTFQYIVKNPSELNKQGDFLYKRLPNMVKLTETYAALTKETTRSDSDLSGTLLLMKTLSAQIADDYHTLLMKDVTIIGEEIKNG